MSETLSRIASAVEIIDVSQRTQAGSTEKLLLSTISSELIMDTAMGENINMEVVYFISFSFCLVMTEMLLRIVG